MPYCNQCGTEYELSRDQCQQCGAGLPRLAEMAGGSADAPSTLSTPTARRVLAGVIDMAVAYALVMYVLILLSRRFPMSRWPVLFGGVTLLVLLMIPNPYLLLKDALRGKSVGKLIAGLIVYNEHEQRASGVFDSVIRNWYLSIPFVGPLLALVMGAQVLGGKSSRLGDRAAHTRVITDLEYQRLR